MNNDEFLQKSQDLIQRVLEANTSDFLELAEIAGLNLQEDLVGADLRGFNLSHADLSYADLSHADLAGANLSHANLSHTDLTNTNLANAKMVGADLSNVRLTEATNLTNADLSDANLIGTNILIANKQNAILKGCKVKDEYRTGALMLFNYLTYGETSDLDCKNVRQLITILFNNDEHEVEIKRPNDLGTQQSFHPNNQREHLAQAELGELKESVALRFEKLEAEDVGISEFLKECLDQAKSLDDVVLVFTYRREIEEIDQAYQYCAEASIWLHNNRTNLIESAEDFMIDREAISTEQIEKFCESIKVYLLWIEHNLAKGSVPILLPEGTVCLALPSSYYVAAFEFIDNMVSTGNDLSSAAIVELQGYLRRFLIRPFRQL